jgi:hypothetical protein
MSILITNVYEHAHLPGRRIRFRMESDKAKEELVIDETSLCRVYRVVRLILLSR